MNYKKKVAIFAKFLKTINQWIPVFHLVVLLDDEERPLYLVVYLEQLGDESLLAQLERIQELHRRQQVEQVSGLATNTAQLKGNY